jgi:hypothetical protein
MLTYDQAVANFEQEYTRNNGFGIASLTLEYWSGEEIKNFLRVCAQAAGRRGASLKAALVGVNVALKLGIDDTIGRGHFFEKTPCFIIVENDRLDLFFGPTRI